MIVCLPQLQERRRGAITEYAQIPLLGIGLQGIGRLEILRLVDSNLASPRLLSVYEREIPFLHDPSIDGESGIGVSPTTDHQSPALCRLA